MFSRSENKLISDRGSEISLFPDSAGNKGRFAQPAGRFPIFGINANMLVVVWGLGVLRGGNGEATGRPRRHKRAAEIAITPRIARFVPICAMEDIGTEDDRAPVHRVINLRGGLKGMGVSTQYPENRRGSVSHCK